MLTFSQFLAEKYLEEKLIMYNQGKRYGQIVFLAGGAGSGKGFAISNFMIKAGYDAKNIHLTWVLTNYAVAIVNNQNRERVVADDIMLLSHEGAATSMYEVIKGKLPKGLNGSVRVILNNRDNTIPYVDPDTKKPMKTSQGNILIKDFTYLTFKKEGKSIGPEMDVKRQLLGWIAANVPKTKLTRDMMGVDPELLDNFKLFDKKT